MWSRKEQVVVRLAFLTGLTLILTNISGIGISPSITEHADQTRIKTIGEHSYPLVNASVLENMLDDPMGAFDLDEVNETIFRSLVHSDKRRIQFYENWLLWLGGWLYEPIFHTQNPRRIVAGGGGLCGEVAAVLNRIAERIGSASSPRLYRVEIVSEWLKWLIPALLILFGIRCRSTCDTVNKA